MFRASVLSLAVLAALSVDANAQGVAPGNLIVSRTVYAGNAGTVTVGQTLPGGGKAVADGAFPNVFKNESPDAGVRRDGPDLPRPDDRPAARASARSRSIRTS